MLERRGGRRRKRLLAAAGVLAALVLTGAALDARLRIRTYTVCSEKLSGSVRIALVTDLHSCRYGKEEAELIAALDEQSPNLVLLGGDICDDELPQDNAEALLRGIAGRYPCYYVTGNHEYQSGDIDAILAMFASYGVTVLSGKSDTVEVRGQYVNICGVTDPDAVRYTGAPDTREQLVALRDVHTNGYYTILLAHRPEWISIYTEYGFDLILSGHAHGGQWRLPGIINGLYAPDQGFFPAYAGGEYTVGSAVMIVSRGLARETTWIPRVFNRPELVVVELRGQS
ncbi:MAG: metallophosphoesterase [Eubacteriales bacterium]